MKKAAAVLVAALLAAPLILKLAEPDDVREHMLLPTDVASGQELFEHQWEPNDPLTPAGDGLGPVFNETSCLACHRQGGAGGGGRLRRRGRALSIDPNGRRL